MNIKYFIGPMTKNVVDAVKEFSIENDKNIGFIPSRRQVSYDGGYVNRWTTKEFKNYVGDYFITRDHGGPGQGLNDDDGYRSLEEDCKYYDMIHIDPWKKYPSYEDGLSWTIDMIKFSHERNSNILYEVGTEQSIRKFEAFELRQFLQDLTNHLPTVLFEKIKYCVIQSGTSLKENVNTGQYDKYKLIEMIKVARDFNLLSKEHNGDYLPPSLIKEKFNYGLDSINIAPEFGLLETEVILNEILHNNLELFDNYWKICFESKKWVKWVDASFDPHLEKEKLIRICGHYILSNEDFIQSIKSNLSSDIDNKVKLSVKNKLRALYE